MSDSVDPMQPLPPGSSRERAGLFAELLRLLMRNMAWWLPPLIVGLVVLAWLLFRGGPGRPEYVYPLSWNHVPK